MAYKWCVVSTCKNTSKSTPHKLFVSVPTDPKRRKLWLQLAGRDPNSIASLSNVFMCEDHLDMENDTINYMKFKMGFSQRILLADKAVPSKLKCQVERKRRLSAAGPSLEASAKRQRIDLVTDCLSATGMNTESSQNERNLDTIETDASTKSQTTKDKGTNTEPILNVEKAVQVTTKQKVYYRSKAVQTKCSSKNISTSPLKVSTTSRFTSPFKIEPCYLQPSQSGAIKARKRNIVSQEEKSSSDISCIESDNYSPFVATSSPKITDSDTDNIENIEKLQYLKHNMHLIKRKPLMYVGITKECYFIVQMMHEVTNIKIEHILLCLKKIRQNSTFSELEDHFGVSISYASKIFLANIPIISSILKPFIVSLDKKLIKKNLPIAFRHHFHNVTCIIDCLEIDVQKPSKALHQALTWSEYKKGNTLKYLISCTPNGLVNYVSQGFGGRTSDIVVVENCDFLDTLPQGTCILADRGFKNLEQLLQVKGMKLVRPPSVNAGTKLSKMEVRQTKMIASLRIHIERVIRRLREFHMLKQHSVINTNFIGILDHIIIIACALINLQDSLIK